MGSKKQAKKKVEADESSSPSGWVIHRAVKHIFEGSNSSSRSLKQIRRLIGEHDDDPKVRELFQQYDREQVCECIRALLKSRMFETLTENVKSLFPTILASPWALQEVADRSDSEMSENQCEDRPRQYEVEELEDEGGNSDEEEKTSNDEGGRSDQQTCAFKGDGFKCQNVAPLDNALVAHLLEQVNGKDYTKAPTSNHIGTLPLIPYVQIMLEDVIRGPRKLLLDSVEVPVAMAMHLSNHTYLPSSTQRALLGKIQDTVEKSFFTWATRHLDRRVFLVNRWNEAEAIEINTVKAFILSKRGSFPAECLAKLRRPLEAVIDSMSQLRHTVVHRNRGKGLEEIRQYLRDAEDLTFLLCCDDNDSSNSLYEITTLAARFETAAVELEHRAEQLKTSLKVAAATLFADAKKLERRLREVLDSWNIEFKHEQATATIELQSCIKSTGKGLDDADENHAIAWRKDKRSFSNMNEGMDHNAQGSRKKAKSESIMAINDNEWKVVTKPVSENSQIDGENERKNEGIANEYENVEARDWYYNEDVDYIVDTSN